MKSYFSWLTSAVLLFALKTNAQTILQIASSHDASFFVKSDGSLWKGDFAHAVAKRKERMQHLTDELKKHPGSRQVFDQIREEGNHNTSDNFEPTDLIVSNGVTAVAMNIQGDTFFTKSDGSLWAMGNNDGGFLGDGTFNTPEHPVQIVSNGVVAVACGQDFTVFLKSDGSLWGFGENTDGALGNSPEHDRVLHPKRIINGDVAAIAAGYSHCLFIKRDGSLWGMGNNGYGQLGLGTNINQTFSPIEIVASNVVRVAAGQNHTLFIKTDGGLWAMGLNDFGQIGDCTIDWPSRPKQIIASDVVAVTAGHAGSLFLKKDGSLWGMGINWGSDYGEGIEFQSRCPTQIFAGNNSTLVAGYYYNAQLKTCASIWAGKFDNNPVRVTSIANITEQQSTQTSISDPNWISIDLLEDGKVRLTYQGVGGKTYAFERSISLTTPNWLPLITNTAPSNGVLVITNSPDITVNNFWRIRFVP